MGMMGIPFPDKRLRVQEGVVGYCCEHFVKSNWVFQTDTNSDFSLTEAVDC